MSLSTRERHPAHEDCEYERNDEGEGTDESEGTDEGESSDDEEQSVHSSDREMYTDSDATANDTDYYHEPQADDSPPRIPELW